MKEYLESLRRSSDKTILVVGDLMLDTYLFGSTDRISPEGPVPVVQVNSRTESLGGSGNVIANLCGINVKVIPIGLIGKDESGRKIKSYLKNCGCSIDGILEFEDITTTEKTRVIAQNQHVVRIDFEQGNDLTEGHKSAIILSLNKFIQKVDAIIISDYGKGVCSSEILELLLNKANSLNVPCIVDPKGNDFKKYEFSTAITPNLKESEAIVPFKLTDDKSIEKACFWISRKFHIKNVLITRGKYGMTLLTNDEIEHIKAQSKEVYDVSGAGDTVIAIMTGALVSGFNYSESARLANAAAGIAVSRIGTSPVHFKEIETFLQANGESKALSKIVDLSELKRRVARWKSEGKTIVFTNGCFDLLHVGHVTLLEQAKMQGDVLVIGLNTDDSIKRIKKNGRPVLKEYERATMLSSLESVDVICFFNQDTPERIINELKPDILLKGGDYTEKEVVGADIVKKSGGRVKIIPIVEGFSTTDIIQKIKNSKELK